MSRYAIGARVLMWSGAAAVAGALATANAAPAFALYRDPTPPVHCYYNGLAYDVGDIQKVTYTQDGKTYTLTRRCGADGHWVIIDIDPLQVQALPTTRDTSQSMTAAI
jgi:hypothetical protein